MSESHLLCVAIPGGRLVDGKAIVRVALVPQLKHPTKQTLADYGMQSWPAAIRASSFVVNASPDPDNDEIDELTSVRTESLQDTLWPKLFPPSTPVRLPSSPWDAEVPSVRPTSSQINVIMRGYKQLALALNPSTASLTLASEHLSKLASDLATIDQMTGGLPNGGAIADREPPDQNEFHYRLTLLREHPEILKAIGFVFELRDVPVPLMRKGLIKVRCEGGAGFPVDLRDAVVSPWTQFQLDDQFFLPAPLSGTDFRRGMVDLADARMADPDDVAVAGSAPLSKWLVAAFDVTGGVAGLRSGQGSNGTQSSVPALRSAGVMLVKCNRQQSFQSRIARAVSNSRRSLQNHVLGAEDLILGYRVDIRRESGQWGSICKRRATYEVSNETVGGQPFIEEGHVRDLVSARVDGGPLQTNEVVVRWNGWSLAVPQPVFSKGGERPPPDLGASVRAFFDKVKLEVPSGPNGGTLPKLRFGNSYILRCRIADVAGGGRTCEDDLNSDECATQRIAYRRVDPVPPPIVAVRNQIGGDRSSSNAFGPGGTVDCLVVRSNPAAKDPVQWENERLQYATNNIRQLFPPAISKELAEYHGVFDDMSAADSWALVQRAISPMAIDANGRYSWLADPTADGVQITAVAAPGATQLRPLRESAWAADGSGKAIVLNAGTSPSNTEWDAADKIATITLRPGEEVSVAITSHVRSANLNLFEISTWLTGASIVDPNHPMLAPPRTLRLVHAVKMPLSKPGGTLRADRLLGATFANLFTGATRSRDNRQHIYIDPADIKIDTASTAQVDVSADWEDVTDDLPGPTKSALVGSLACARGQVRIPTLTHEFGDTKHRVVRYSMTAISRFTEFFNIPKDSAGNPVLDEFKRAGDRIEVGIPSSARPPPPTVLSIVPSFRWQGPQNFRRRSQSVVRRRTAGIRLELARPWSASGDGECLAVILPIQPSAQAVPYALQKLVSWVHRDPIWPAPAPSALLRADDFQGDRLAAATVQLPHVDGNSTDRAIIAVPYRVKFAASNDQKACYADIELSTRADESYGAMVRLVVGRYQPNSIPGVELSLAVATDFVQLMPSRTLTVTREAGAVRVLLLGLGPQVPAPNRVIARIERYAGSENSIFSSTASDLAVDDNLAMAGWRRVAGAEGRLNQEFELAMPANDHPLRLVVSEVEQFRMPIGVDTENAFGRDLQQRTVFLDVVALS